MSMVDGASPDEIEPQVGPSDQEPGTDKGAWQWSKLEVLRQSSINDTAQIIAIINNNRTGDELCGIEDFYEMLNAVYQFKLTGEVAQPKVSARPQLVK